MYRFLVLVLIPIFLFSANLQKGWNLVGSGSNINPSSDATMSDSSKVESVWVYQNGAWSVFRGGQSSGVSSIDSQYGFWVNSLVDLNSLWEDGSSSNVALNVALNVNSSWNLLSSPNGSEINPADLEAESIFTYKNGNWANYSSSKKEISKLGSSDGFWAFYLKSKTIYVNENNQIVTGEDLTTAEDVFNSRGYTLIGWNDLGMHCVDGKDYSVFSILPPYNNLVVQLIKKDGTDDKHIKSGVTITYEAVAGLSGATNTTSVTKTNFWDYMQKLFNTTKSGDVGLTGKRTPSLTPDTLTFNSSRDWWEANGIPVMNYDDNGDTNYYPMVKVVAKDSSNSILATTKVVLPVSDEMDCKACHGSNSDSNAKPSTGWVNNSDSLKDFKLNILKLHDDKHKVSSYLAELKTMGYEYQSSLYDTAVSGTPILCATCHKSNALETTGLSGVKSLTKALHGLHADVNYNGATLDDSTNRDSCYSCHPGQTTECLRGAMSSIDSINCQSCHGNMSAVAKSSRDGWLDEPDCQSCHQDGHRYTTAVTDISTGTLREAVDNRFATESNKPIAGKSLYRFSSGHGDMQCSSCHGSTHAIYPSKKEEDNVQNIGLQGYKGTLSDCMACHTKMPFTNDEGPHGMHSISQDWVEKHEDYAEDEKKDSCKACHGTDLKGSFLSKTFNDRTFSTKWGTKNFPKGTQIGCFDCHSDF